MRLDDLLCLHSSRRLCASFSSFLSQFCVLLGCLFGCLFGFVCFGFLARFCSRLWSPICFVFFFFSCFTMKRSLLSAFSCSVAPTALLHHHTLLIWRLGSNPVTPPRIANVLRGESVQLFSPQGPGRTHFRQTNSSRSAWRLAPGGFQLLSQETEPDVMWAPQPNKQTDVWVEGLDGASNHRSFCPASAPQQRSQVTVETPAAIFWVWFVGEFNQRRPT